MANESDCLWLSNGITIRWSGHVKDKVPNSNVGAPAAQRNRQVSSVLRKVLGSLVASLGAVAAALSTYAFSRATAMADLAEGVGDDRATYVFHWQFTTGLYATLALMLLVGGCLILARYSVGALVSAVAIFLSGIASWISSAVGFSRYPFEQPNLVETIILVGLSGFLLLLFIRQDVWNQPAMPDKSPERTRER